MDGTPKFITRSLIEADLVRDSKEPTGSNKEEQKGEFCSQLVATALNGVYTTVTDHNNCPSFSVIFRDSFSYCFRVGTLPIQEGQRLKIVTGLSSFEDRQEFFSA